MKQAREPLWPSGTGEMATLIRHFDWSGTSLGPLIGWPERLRAYVDLILASPQISSLACGAECLLIYNDAAASLYGERHPAALGRSLPDVFPEGWATVGPLYERAFAGEAVQANSQSLDLRGEGPLSTAFDAVLTPLRDEAGTVAYVHMAGQEVSARLRTEATLRDSEERLSLAIEVGEMASWDWDLRTGLVKWNDRHFLMQGYEVNEVPASFEAWLAAVHPEDRNETVMLIEQARDNKQTYAHEFRSLHRDGRLVWCAARGRFFYDKAGQPYRMIGVVEDVTERKQHELALLQVNERQNFFSKLDDELRPLTDAEEIKRTGCRLVREHLAVDRAYFVNFEHQAGYGEVADDHRSSGLASLAGRYPLEQFETTYARIADGRTWIVDNVVENRDLAPSERDYYASVGVISWVDVPLLKQSKLEAVLCVVHGAERSWAAGEVAVVEQTAERLWAAVQRSRAETALRNSEARFQQFGEASTDVLWMRDAQTLQMDYVSPAFEQIYGRPLGSLMNGDNFLGWLEMIHPEDRADVMAEIERVRQGETTSFEYRIKRADGGIRWLRNTDFPLRNAWGEVIRIGGIGHDITEQKESSEQLKIVVQELQHRTRNLMNIVQSIASQTLKRSQDLEQFDASFTERLQALSRVQGLLFRFEGRSIDLGELIRSELDALAAEEANVSVSAEGPAIALRLSGAQTLALALHELATNARKYGALSPAGGSLQIRWKLEGKPDAPTNLQIEWAEATNGVVLSDAGRRGYGRQLLERGLALAMDAQVHYGFSHGGLTCVIRIPLDKIQVWSKS